MLVDERKVAFRRANGGMAGYLDKVDCQACHVAGL